VEITELDVANDGLVDDPVAKAAVFRRYALACRLAPNCVGYTVWGVADRYSWLGPFSDALLYDADFRPRPVAAVVHGLLSGRTPRLARPSGSARPQRGHARRR
jgi:endo-1,4-beta-xylanase